MQTESDSASTKGAVQVETLISQTARTIAPYVTASQAVWEQSEDIQALKLDWNEATISPAPAVLRAIKGFLASDRLHYYPNVSNGHLQSMIARYVGLPQEFIQYFASSDAAHEYIAQAFLEPNSVVIIVAPTYDNFRIPCQSRGADIYRFQLCGDLRLNFSELTNEIQKKRPRLVYICNPNNPTGSLHDLADIQQLVDRFRGTVFVIDEAYFEYSGVTIAYATMKFVNLVVTRTFSKAFALANLRLGYVVAHPAVVSILNRLRNAKSVSSISQVAAIAALEEVDYMRSYVADVLEAKAFFQNSLAELSGCLTSQRGGHGNFSMVGFSTTVDKNVFVDRLKSRSVYVRDLAHVGSLGQTVRVTIGTRRQMATVVRIIKEIYGAEDDRSV